MSDQEASSSADSEIDENTLTNIPINIDDKDFIKKITKSQLVEIIKNLSKDIESLKVKPCLRLLQRRINFPILLSLQILPSLPIYLNR